MKDANNPHPAHHHGPRDNFGSSFGVLVALAGSAVGLGNLWRFPYLVGENGGAAFIIIYLAFVILIGIPILMSEFIIGRRSQANARGAFKKLAPESRWGFAGILAVLCCVMILSFYSVVGGWGIEYLFKAFRFDFTRGGDSAALSSIFSDFAASSWQPLV
ncbi:MAG: sodium-dependent transporter, partial [Bacteroidales bacterium]|nr:sodium-dependent transporter [Bacteroidales bacterium]